MLSNYFIDLLKKLYFLKIVITRFLIILFRRRKEIELLLLDYNTSHLFDNSFIFINYRFKNAIYYKFGKHKTLEKEIKIFNLKNIEKEFQLTIYGFFRKKTYKVVIYPKLNIDTSNFETEFSNLEIELLENNLIESKHPKKHPKIDKLKINISNIHTENKKLNIQTNSFNQNEFI